MLLVRLEVLARGAGWKEVTSPDSHQILDYCESGLGVQRKLAEPSVVKGIAVRLSESIGASKTK